MDIMTVEQARLAEILAGVTISASAAEAVRLKFNPSGNDRVQRIKILTAALITEVEGIGRPGPANPRVAPAIERVIDASMWSVLAATWGL